jgi:peptidoglycan/xylan/chitin deacetylase (PgdA/CDA1 family)
MSNYLFDIWHRRSESVLSWEISSQSGNLIGIHGKIIALTFDDGPSEQYTNRLLDILKTEGVHATFFVLGRNAEKYPQILAREYREWHEIGNHSYSHTLFTKLSTGAIQDEIYRTDQAIYHAIWAYPTIFRPPYGSTNTGVLAVIHMPAILWSIDTRDWQTHSIAQNITSVQNIKDGDIIIMHDIHETSVESVAAIIVNLRARGFTFVTISELLWLSPGNTEVGKKCSKKTSCK